VKGGPRLVQFTSWRPRGRGPLSSPALCCRFAETECVSRTPESPPLLCGEKPAPCPVTRIPFGGHRRAERSGPRPTRRWLEIVSVGAAGQRGRVTPMAGWRRTGGHKESRWRAEPGRAAGQEPHPGLGPRASAGSPTRAFPTLPTSTLRAASRIRESRTSRRSVGVPAGVASLLEALTGAAPPNVRSR
jgi:hypothetical protein